MIVIMQEVFYLNNDGYNKKISGRNTFLPRSIDISCLNFLSRRIHFRRKT